MSSRARGPRAGLSHPNDSFPFAPQDALARNVTLEQGKTLGDARGDVFRGLGAT